MWSTESGYRIQRSDFAAVCEFLVVACVTSVSVGTEFSVFCLGKIFSLLHSSRFRFCAPQTGENTQLAK